jgi:hypothetical protein
MQGIPETKLVVSIQNSQSKSKYSRQSKVSNNMNNTDVFIENARLKHGDTYDYSKVKYVLSNKHIIIICKIHGEFLQTPNAHLCGYGCKQCGIKRSADSKKCNQNEFIQNAIKQHGELYDYSKSIYVKRHSNVIIICKIHGEFLQMPHNHLSGTGCRKCGNIKISEGLRSSTSEFIHASRIKHGDVYDYTNVLYINNVTKVIIACKIHGDFKQSPCDHIMGSGCQKCSILTCANGRKSNTTDFIDKTKKIHGDLYDYSKSEYVSSYKKLIIICKIHGEFYQAPTNHLSGKGCDVCGGSKRLDTNGFIEKAIKKQGELYDYSKVKYVKAINNVTIICKIHGEYQQTPSSHLAGHGCQLCLHKTEGKLYDKLKALYPSITTQFKQEWCKIKKCLPYDFCIPDLNIIIELDGEQHFKNAKYWKSSWENVFKNDKYKQECANANHYSMIRLLQYDVWNDKYDWIKELCDAIESIQSCGGETVTNIYLCKNNEYCQYLHDKPQEDTLKSDG